MMEVRANSPLRTMSRTEEMQGHTRAAQGA